MKGCACYYYFMSMYTFVCCANIERSLFAHNAGITKATVVVIIIIMIIIVAFCSHKGGCHGLRLGMHAAIYLA